MIGDSPAAPLPSAGLPNPLRGEVWRVALDPARGSELKKTRPVVVLSAPGLGHATVRVCVPLTGWQPEHRKMSWCQRVAPDVGNGLTKVSTADAAQVRTLDVVRFANKLGTIAPGKLAAIAAAVALVVEYEPPAPATPATA